MAVLDLEVVGGNERTEARVLNVAVEVHCAERGAGGGQVGRSLEGRGLQVDEDGVSVRTGALGGSRAGVVGAGLLALTGPLSRITYTEVAPSKVMACGSASESLAPLTSQCRVNGVFKEFVPGISASIIMTV